MTALRVLIVWIYANTGSVLLAQLLHASSTGFLVVLGPTLVSPAQEAEWYAIYALILWVVVAGVVARYGKSLRGPISRGTTDPRQSVPSPSNAAAPFAG